MLALPPTDHSELTAQIRHLVGHGRMREALEYLNLSSPYRFTALYRISDDRLHNLVLFDREAPDQPVLETMPLGDSYCVFVRDGKDAFIVGDAPDDARVDGHPKRPTIHAYCGVPLLGMGGDVCGTVCHFDFDAVPADTTSVAALETFASLLNPRTTSDLLERGLAVQVDALEAMLGPLADTCSDLDEATAAFEEFARPVRVDARALPAPARQATDARIDALLASLPARLAAHAGGTTS